MILIFSYKSDPHASAVIEILKNTHKEEVLLLDYSEYPNTWSIGIDVNNSGTSISFHVNGKVVNASEVSSIWYRRVRGNPLEKNKKIEKSLSTYIQEESKAFFLSLSNLLDGYWISDPSKIEIASRKPFQLKTAIEVNFLVPKTIFGNSIKSVKDFILENPKLKLVTKSINSSTAIYDTEVKKHRVAVFTHKISHKQVEKDIHLVQNCPVIIQELIDSVYEVRVTVVGEEVFACAIKSSVKNNITDIRHPSVKKEYQYIQLPKDITLKCVKLLKKLGLRYGSIDLLVAENNKYYFLEINPVGQWLLYEESAGIPISKAVAKLLSSSCSR